MFAIVGAAFVPIAVPMFCMNNSELYSKMLNLSTWSSSSMSVSVDTVLSCLVYFSLSFFSVYLWGQLCERVTVTDGCRLYNFYEHVITQQLISAIVIV